MFEAGGPGITTWATAMSTNNAWWMPLLEKAYAKLDQNYDRLTGGWGKEGLRTLTGMPVMDFKHDGKSEDYLLPLYKQFASKNFPMTTGCCRGDLHGLIDSHAYTFLDIQDLKDGDGKVVHTLAKLRNPWAVERYNGPFRDNDPIWTDQWKKQVNLVEANDGVFWMPLDIFFS